MINPDLKELTRYANTKKSKIITHVKDLLTRPEVNNTKGIRRVALVCEHFQQMTYDQAYHIIDPDAFQDEFEEAQSYKSFIKLLSILRIVLSLAPLILTWYALFSATSAYQKDLAKYSDDQTITFLRLWQEGFHHTTSFTFSTTAIIDVVLLVSFLACSVLITLLEYGARRRARIFADDLRTVTAELLQAVIDEGMSQTTKQADIDKIVKAVRASLDGAFANTADVVKQALDVVVKANDRVEQLFTNQVQPMFTKFDQNITTFQHELSKLTQETRTIAASSTAIAASSTAMATASSSMTDAATKMTASANDLRTSVQQIDTHLVKLDQTENSMVTRIEMAQQRVAGEVTKAATSMNNAAIKVETSTGDMKRAADQVEQAGKALTVLDKHTIQQITNDTIHLSGLVKQLNNDLRDTIVMMRKMMVQPRNIFQRMTQGLRGVRP